MKKLSLLVFAFALQLPLLALEPVWVKGAEREMNAFFGFAAKFDAKAGDKAEIRFSAASIARVWVNGEFAAYGPARAPEGFMRVDVWPIGAHLKDGENIVAIEVANSGVNEFYFPESPAFLAAEVSVGGKIVASAARDFKAIDLPVVRETSRFSYQRGFGEFYSVTPESKRWRTEGIPGEGLAIGRVFCRKELPRGVSYPDMSIDRTFKPTVRSALKFDAERKIKLADTLNRAGKGNFKGFAVEKLKVNMFERVQRLVAVSTGPCGGGDIELAAMEGVAYEGEKNTAGFPMVEVECLEPATLWLAMDEFAAASGLPDPVRFFGCVNAMGWRLEKPGRYRLESMHPYGLKCAHLMVESGKVKISSFAVRSYLNSDVKRAKFKCSDAAFDKIFAAAKQSLACNAVDIFTDCPGRERGAYFGDTIFTGRGADVLLGDCGFERVLFENYALAEKFKDVPEGMIPMCYPADVMLDKPHWIPNFGLWSVVQLFDYLERSGDKAMVEAFRPKAEGLLKWFRSSRNEMGLLENLPGWVFVEWSDASRFVNGISFATNMTYIRFLDAFAGLYGDESCAKEAAKLRDAVLRLSWRGEWFCDNATRDGKGRLKFTGEATELNQYLAFFSGVASREKCPGLWSRILELGPMRKPGAYPKLWPSNLLFGFSLRLVLLSEAGESERVLDEVRHLFLPMAEKTGTLWESVGTDGYSCCHGFPSMAAWLIARDALGVKSISRAEKKVEIEIPRSSRLDWCEATIPLSASEELGVRWRKDGGRIVHEIDLPAGWSR